MTELFTEQQLEACGVDYFDFYLMHAQDANSFRRYKALGCYETSLELLKEGKILKILKNLLFHLVEMVLKTQLELHSFNLVELVKMLLKH